MRFAIAIAVLVALYLLLRGRKGAASTATYGNNTAPVGPPAIDDFMQVIFQHEGGNEGNRNVRDNNPGMLKYGANQVSKDGPFAVFGDQGDGWDALGDYTAQKASAHPDWDFYDFFQNYLGQAQGGPTVTNQGNSDAYAEYVADYMGVDPSQSVYSTLYGG